MRNRRRRSVSESQPSLSGQLMGLSLFIMLLAFFIVLNAISVFSEDKARPVIESLGSTFRNGTIEDSLLWMGASEGESIGRGDSLDELEALFNAHITGIKVDQDKLWGTMHIQLPLNVFMDALSSLEQRTLKKPNASASKNFFLPTLVSLLETEDSKVPYRMDVVVSTKSDPGDLVNDNPEGMRAISQNLTFMAEKLEDAGLASYQMSVGMQKGSDNTIDLYFRPFKPFSPLNSGASK